MMNKIPQQVTRPMLLVMTISGATPPQTLPLAQDVVTIGRAPTNTLVLNDTSVSREHLRLERRGQIWHVMNLASGAAHSALYVDGRPLVEADLQGGEQLVIGGIALRFTLSRIPEDDGRHAPNPPPVAVGQHGTIMADAPTPTIFVKTGAVTFAAPLRQASITLGRDPACGLILPSPLASARHAVLTSNSDGRYTITDTGSSNGLYLAGQRITSRLLVPGDTLTIGDPTDPHSISLTFSIPGFVSANARSGPIPPRISAPQPGATGTVTIGRDPVSTFCLPNPLTSWHHAVLDRQPGGQVILRDLNSTNGTYVNFQRITLPAILRPGDLVHIGIYDFVFDGQQLAQGHPQGQGMRIDVYDLVRTIKNGQQVLLDHVTLTVQPGEFIAIAGGSGAGKTTLMRALAGIQPAQHGKVFFNGIDAYQHYNVFRGTIGYVPQADIVHSALTVERALYYAARLRLATDVRPEEITQRITSVLTTVNLTHRRNNIISSLSGGERKRVNLAVELLADPPVLFLDEPNAGLDPNLRQELIQTMRDLAAKGRTIVLVTHHIEDIEACDRLAFMGSGGRLCYFGPPREALPFFRVSSFERLYAEVDTPQKSEMRRNSYNQSPIFGQYIRAALPQQPKPQMGGMPMGAAQSRQGWTPARSQSQQQHLTPLEQWWLLMQRYTETLIRDRVNLGILLLQAPIIGLLMFGISKNGLFTDVSNLLLTQRILFFLAICAIWFGTSNSAREISKEVEIYQRERLAGLGIFPYIFSKVGVLGMLCLVQTLVLEIFVLLRTGLPPSAAGVFFGPAIDMYVALMLAGLAALAMGLCVSAAANTPDKALSAVPLVLIPQILLAGLIFSLSGPLQVVGDLTISHWTIESVGAAVNLNELYYNSQVTAILVKDPQTPDASIIASINQQNANPGNRPYDPTFYGNPDLTPTYVDSVRDFSDWSAGLGARRAQWILTDGAMVILFVVFISGAVVLQKLKDPR